MQRIIFVCSGNICRSPLAAGMAKAKLEVAQVPSVVISAGTLNINGQSAAPNAIEAGKLVGIDITAHRSQGVSLPLMAMADHIVVMAPRHENALVDLDPNLEEKIVRMWAYGEHPEKLDQIVDPVGQDLEAFVQCRKRLDICLDAWIRTLPTG